MAFCYRLVQGARDTAPCLHQDVFAERDVPFYEHLFPDDGCQACFTNAIMVEVDEPLDERLEDFGVIGVKPFLKLVEVHVDFVAAGVEVGAVGCYPWEQILPKAGKKCLNQSIVELQLA